MSTPKILRNLDVDESGDAGVAVPCILRGYYAFNAASSIRYLKLYDTAAAPTVGTDTPKMTLALPASSGANMIAEKGLMRFSKGIGLGATTAVADNDTGAPSANDVIVNLFWDAV